MSTYSFKNKSKAQREKEDQDASEERFAEDEQIRAQMESTAYNSRLARLQPHKGLKELRTALGISQTKIAKSCGVSRRTYQFYESGDKAIPSTVICRLSAKYLFDIHRLFSGQPHSDYLRVRTVTAQLAAKVVLHLSNEFPEMTDDEKQHIAMEFARSNKADVQVTNGMVFDSIRIVTGDKYVKEEMSYYDAFGCFPGDPSEDEI